MTQTATETNGQDSALLDGPSTLSSYVAQLPLREWGLVNCPAIPYWADVNGDPDLEHVGRTLKSLNARGEDGKPAYGGLLMPYTIAGQTHTAYEFLFGSPPTGATVDGGATASTPPNKLALDTPEQFTLAWTTYGDVYDSSEDLVGPFADTLNDVPLANASFWPTIASFGLPYNLIVLAKIGADRAGALAEELGDAWDEDLQAAQAAGLAYEIDMRILSSVGPFTTRDGTVRFAPATVTVLKQDAVSKALTPVAVKLWTGAGVEHVYTSGDPAWLYALQAAKASITVYGIWLGHVYHWHIVTAATQMTMFNRLPAGHRLWPLLQPQSQSLIDFDFVLLAVLFGKISPPTPVSGYMGLLKLLDDFAEGRDFFDDDPAVELKQRGIDVKDFTVKTAWDAYPIVGYMLDIFTITRRFVSAVVDDMYASDKEVAADAGLQAWMAATRDPVEGNIRGLPAVDTRAALTAVLTSILYRITVHGAGSLNPSVNPALAFVSNFPPCLQSDKVPAPGTRVSTTELLELLPHTGTIGGMTTFYYTFVYSPPYVPLIPKGGNELDPYFPPSKEASNKALFAYRKGIRAFVDSYVADWNRELARLRGGSPGPPPAYAEGQYEQWPRSIEI